MEKVQNSGIISVEGCNQYMLKKGRWMMGPMTRSVVRCTLAQRRRTMMMKEATTELRRGSYAVERYATHPIQRRRKWRRLA